MNSWLSTIHPILEFFQMPAVIFFSGWCSCAVVKHLRTQINQADCIATHPYLESPAQDIPEAGRGNV